MGDIFLKLYLLMLLKDSASEVYAGDYLYLKPGVLTFFLDSSTKINTFLNNVVV